MPANARSTPFDSRNLYSVFPFISGQVLDNTRVGSWTVLVARSIGTGDTSLTHMLGKTPQGYYVTRNSSGGVVYDASSGATLWTPTAIVVRASVSGTFTLWVY